MIQGKNVTFISTKNADYIRNTQEIELIRENAKTYTVIASMNKSYIKRILYVYWSLMKKILKGNSDLYFVGFAPQLLLPMLFFLKKPVIIDFFISVYDTLVDDRKKVRADSFVARCIHAIDKKTLGAADLLICDTKAHRDYFSKEFRIEKDMFQVLYLEADVSIYKVTEVVKKLDQAVFQVLYFGSILPVQGVDVILRAMELLVKEKQIRFTMIGPLVREYDSIKNRLNNTEFIEWMDQKNLAKRVAESDLCLAGHFSDEVGKANRTIAGKTYIYKALNKPVILGDSDANRELFVEDDMNYYVERGNPQKLALCIKQIAEETLRKRAGGEEA